MLTVNGTRTVIKWVYNPIIKDTAEAYPLPLHKYAGCVLGRALPHKVELWLLCRVYETDLLQRTDGRDKVMENLINTNQCMRGEDSHRCSQTVYQRKN